MYGSYVERVFGPDKIRKTPALTMADGVDFIPLPTWKIFMIQFLNIAGLVLFFILCTELLIYCIFFIKILAKTTKKVYNTFVIGSRAAFGLIISCKSGGELEYGTSYRKRKRKFGIRS